MALRWHRLPAEDWSKRRFPETGRLIKAPKQFHVCDHVSDFERAKIMIRHEVEVRLDFLGIIGPETGLDQSLARFPGCFHASIKQRPPRQTLTAPTIQLPAHGSRPVRRVLVARPLAIRQR